MKMLMLDDEDNELLDEIKAARPGDMMTIRHLGGAEREVKFLGLYGKDLASAEVRFPMAGDYRAILPSGKVVGGKLRELNTPWTLVESDVLRLLALRKREKDRKL